MEILMIINHVGFIGRVDFLKFSIQGGNKVITCISYHPFFYEGKGNMLR